MDTLTLPALMLCAVVIVVAIVAMRSRYLFVASMRRVEVVVQLKSGSTVKGILYASYADSIVLKDASAAPSGSSELVAIDGDQVIPRDNVDWIQTIGGGA